MTSSSQQQTEEEYAPWQEIVIPPRDYEYNDHEGNRKSHHIDVQKFVVWKNSKQSEHYTQSSKSFIVGQFRGKEYSEGTDCYYVDMRCREDLNLYALDFNNIDWHNETHLKELNSGFGCSCNPACFSPDPECEHATAVILFLRKKREFQMQNIEPEGGEYTAEFIHYDPTFKATRKGDSKR